jgi:hypothetical protein
VHQSRSFLPNAHIIFFRLICEQLCPDYTGIELGIGESLLVKAIGESTGRSLQLIKADLKKEGDLGLVAMVRNRLFLMSVRESPNVLPKNSKNMQKTLFKPKALTVPFVFSNLKEIALSAGHSVSRSPWDSQTLNMCFSVSRQESVDRYETPCSMQGRRGKIHRSEFGGQASDRQRRAHRPGGPCPRSGFGGARAM